MEVSIIRPFVIALLIGLLIGIERERSHKRNFKFIGVRSFTLLALLGATASWINQTALTFSLSVAAFGLIALGYWKSTNKRSDPDLGLTTEIAGLVVFGLGYSVRMSESLSILLGLVVLVVLSLRKPLHRFSRDILKAEEVTAAITLLVIILGVLPFLPETAIDPWGMFAPKRFVTIFVLLSGVQFAGYALGRILGESRGSIVSGFLGGLVSSTAVHLLAGARIKKSKIKVDYILRECVMAVVASLCLMLLIVGFSAKALFASIAWPVALTISSLLLLGILFLNGKAIDLQDSEGQIYPSTPALRSQLNTSPLDMRAAARFATLLLVLLFLIGWIRSGFGPEMLFAVSLISGLFELHSIVVSLSSGIAQATQERIDFTANALLIAATASILSKTALILFMNRDRHGAKLAGIYGLSLIVGALSWYFS